jgi:hypothetical protein
VFLGAFLDRTPSRWLPHSTCVNTIAPRLFHNKDLRNWAPIKSISYENARLLRCHGPTIHEAMHTRTAVGHFVAPQPWPGLPTLNAALKLTPLEQPIIRTALFLYRIPELQNFEILFRMNINSFKYSTMHPRQIEKMGEAITIYGYRCSACLLCVSLTYTILCASLTYTKCFPHLHAASLSIDTSLIHTKKKGVNRL